MELVTITNNPCVESKVGSPHSMAESWEETIRLNYYRNQGTMMMNNWYLKHLSWSEQSYQLSPWESPSKTRRDHQHATVCVIMESKTRPRGCWKGELSWQGQENDNSRFIWGRIGVIPFTLQLRYMFSSISWSS